MRINWKSLGGAIVSVVTTAIAVVDPTKLPPKGAAIVAILGTLVAAFSGHAVKPAD